MHPVGTNSAASFPKISAARVSSRFTVGSSPYTSSPTSAAAIAARISAEGRVNVSLRNSTAPATGLARFSSITTSVLVSVATFLLFPVRLLGALCAPTSAPCQHAVLLNSFTLTLFNSLTLLLHQFHKHFVRHAHSPRCQSHQAPLPLNQSRRPKPRKSRLQRNSILSFNTRNINPAQLSQPQKQLLLQSTLRGQFFNLLDRQSSRRKCRDIIRGIMRISPPLRPRKRMRPSPKSQIRLAPPIFQIMPRSKSRPPPIRNLIMLITRRAQNRARRL